MSVIFYDTARVAAALQKPDAAHEVAKLLTTTFRELNFEYARDKPTADEVLENVARIICGRE